jgi:hypothetical protein
VWQEYVERYLQWLLDESVAPQFDAFKRGFDRVMDGGGPALGLLKP